METEMKRTLFMFSLSYLDKPTFAPTLDSLASTSDFLRFYALLDLKKVILWPGLNCCGVYERALIWGIDLNRGDEMRYLYTRAG